MKVDENRIKQFTFNSRYKRNMDMSMSVSNRLAGNTNIFFSPRDIVRKKKKNHMSETFSNEMREVTQLSEDFGNMNTHTHGESNDSLNA